MGTYHPGTPAYTEYINHPAVYAPAVLISPAIPAYTSDPIPGKYHPAIPETSYIIPAIPEVLSTIPATAEVGHWTKAAPEIGHWVAAALEVGHWTTATPETGYWTTSFGTCLAGTNYYYYEVTAFNCERNIGGTYIGASNYWTPIPAVASKYIIDTPAKPKYYVIDTPAKPSTYVIDTPATQAKTIVVTPYIPPRKVITSPAIPAYTENSTLGTFHPAQPALYAKPELITSAYTQTIQHPEIKAYYDPAPLTVNNKPSMAPTATPAPIKSPTVLPTPASTTLTPTNTQTTPIKTIPVSLSTIFDQSDINATAWKSINLYGAYQQLGLTPQTAGLGIKIGVIDSGIGVFPANSNSNQSTLACFTASPNLVNTTQNNSTSSLNQTQFTNSKVTIARTPGLLINDRSGKAEKPASAQAVGPHGSHVAGIIGCNPNTSITLYGKQIGTLTGIAPAVTLGSYNIFPDNASVNINDIGAMVKAAVDDGMNIINMSLGISADADPLGYGTDNGVLEEALKYAEAHNVLVVAASGNDGVDQVLRPANIDTVLSVAVVSGGVNAVHALTVNNQTYTMLGGSVGWSTAPVSALLYPVTPTLETGCSPLSKNYAGKIAVLKRGQCRFDAKFTAAKKAGALGVVLVDYPTSLADLHLSSETTNDPILPGGIISTLAWNKITAWLQIDQTQNSTISATTLQSVPIKTLLSFSSYNSKGALRPDLSAPGAGIFSSITATGCNTCYMIADGTSMASPVVAAIAALLYQQHPNWTVGQIRSALIHTASTKDIKAAGSLPDPGIRVRGTGVIDALAAINTTLVFTTSNTQITKNTGSVQITNLTNSKIEATITTTGVVKSTQSKITLPAASTIKLDLTTSMQGLGEVIITPSNGSPIHQNISSN